MHASSLDSVRASTLLATHKLLKIAKQPYIGINFGSHIGIGMGIKYFVMIMSFDESILHV